MITNSVFTPLYTGSLSHSAVSASATSQLLIDASYQRRKLSLYNHSGASLFIRYSTSLDHSASLGTFTVKLSSGSYYEMANPIYTGQIHGIWDAEDGVVMITQLEEEDQSGW